MSLKKSVPPLQLEPRSSRHLALILLFLHGVALSAIAVLSAPAWVHLALSLAVILNFYSTFSVHIMGRGKLAILSMVWNGEGDWNLLTATGESLTARLQDNSYVHPYLVILNFLIPKHGRRSVILLPDSLDKSTMRKLLTRIRHEGNRNQSEE